MITNASMVLVAGEAGAALALARIATVGGLLLVEAQRPTAHVRSGRQIA